MLHEHKLLYFEKIELHGISEMEALRRRARAEGQIRVLKAGGGGGGGPGYAG